MNLKVGDEVTVDGRLLVVRGFDPMGVPAPRVYLDDPVTGERVVELAARLTGDPALPPPRRLRDQRPT